MAAITLIDGVQAAESDTRHRVMLPNVIAEFKRADKYLQPMRP